MNGFAPAAGGGAPAVRKKKEGALPPSFGLPRDIFETKTMERGAE
ncbi:hypothetical protein OCA8868_00131 [Octadecabacter ascidiaceicola]|uniref:Uncharacterized protein n=1 Tax=Octadecabacter ascidiaceicola TaxID=1655543 RepID=A0A238JKG7_9RHOB|nr:hypothetical protein OCA8868_00131 [Octadecabacter ascidiaceicola]